MFPVEHDKQREEFHQEKASCKRRFYEKQKFEFSPA